MADELFNKQMPPPETGGTPQPITTPNPPGGPMTPGAQGTFPMPSGEGPGGPPEEFDEENATPEEQAAYDQFVVRAMQSITNNAKGVIDRMNNPERSVYENVGETGLEIMQQIEQLASARGAKITPEIMAAAGTEVAEMLMQLGDAAGIWPFEKDSDEYNEAMVMAMYHGATIAGERQLKGGDAAQFMSDSQDVAAVEIANERAEGTIHPDFDNVMNQAMGMGEAKDGEL